MAANVQFDLVSPERKLTSVLVEQVQIPGADGDLTAMAGHEPTILSLRPGLLTATGPGVEEQYVVTGALPSCPPTRSLFWPNWPCRGAKCPKRSLPIFSSRPPKPTKKRIPTNTT